MTPRDPQTSARTRLLNAALGVVRTKGYSATTVDELCAAAGVTKGAFFHHFKSKEDLAVQAAQHWSDLTNGLFDSADFRKHADPLDRFYGYLDLRRQLIQGALPEFTCFLGTMVQEAFDTSPAIRDACRRGIFGHAEDIARDIEAARALYAPDATWTAKSLGLHTQAVIQGAFILAKSSGDPAIAAESIDHLRRYVETLFHREKKKESV